MEKRRYISGTGVLSQTRWGPYQCEASCETSEGDVSRDSNGTGESDFVNELAVEGRSEYVS